MIGFKQSFSRGRRRIAVAIVGVSVAVAMLGTGWMASAQDQSAAKVEDVIVARKTVMDTLSDNMDQIEQMISTNKIDLSDAHEHADTISVMLMAFPHLFPPASNQWKPGADIDPVTGTYASPDVWGKFPDFYKRGADASKTAYDMSRADKVDELKSKTAELRTACNACHAAYLKTQ